MFYLHIKILHRGYFGLTTALVKHCLYRFTDIPPPDLRIITTFTHSRSDGPTEHLRKIVKTDHKGQAEVCRWYVGESIIIKTIFINSKMLLFKILTFLPSYNPFKSVFFGKICSKTFFFFFFNVYSVQQEFFDKKSTLYTCILKKM